MPVSSKAGSSMQVVGHDMSWVSSMPHVSSAHRWEAIVSVNDILQVRSSLIAMVAVVIGGCQVLDLVLYHLNVHTFEPAGGMGPWWLCRMLPSRYCEKSKVSDVHTRLPC